MSNNQLAGFPAFGPRVDSEIIYNPRIITFDPAIDVPVSPDYAYVEITIGSGDLPTFSPYTPPHASSVFNDMYNCYLLGVVQNVTATTTSLYGSYLLSGETYSASDSVSLVGYKYGHYYAPGLTEVSLGATQKLRFYATAADKLKIIAAYMMIYPKNICSGLTSGVADLQITLSTGSMIGGAAPANEAFSFGSGPCAVTTSTSISMKGAEIYNADTRGFGYVVRPSHNGLSSSNAAPYYNSPVYPTRIAYTPIL